jgi:hypothetical protein
MRAIPLIAVACLAVTPAVAGSNLWSIYWKSEPLPCNGGGPPIVSAYHRPLCPIGAYTIFPTPQVVVDNPFDRGKPITITCYQLSQILSDPTASGYAVVGSWHVGANGENDGADVFASGAGIGSWTREKNLSAGLPQGGGNDAHIDVYAACDKGTQQILLVLEYVERAMLR